MNRNIRNDNPNRNRSMNQNRPDYDYRNDESNYRRGHSHYRNEGDFGGQNSVRGYGNYGNMGSYGGAQGYGEHNSNAQQQRGYYGQAYGDERYQQQNQRPNNQRNWQQDDTPYGDWRENAGYYRQRQDQPNNYYGQNRHQNQWENQAPYEKSDYSSHGHSYGPGNTTGGAYMGSGYSRISEGEYGPMLGDEGSETAYSRQNGGYSSRGGYANPGKTFNSISNSFWDEDRDIDYGATFGDDIEYNPYEAPRKRRSGSQEGRNRNRNR